MTTVERAPITVAELVAAVRDQRAATTLPQVLTRVVPARATAVLVVGAHGGAGASTVSVALAEAASGGGRNAAVCLIDLAALESSGVATAAGCEIGCEYAGWRASRRDLVTILGQTIPNGSATNIPDHLTRGFGHTIIDLGRHWSHGTTMPSYGAATQTVLVCRASVPGLRHAERALAELPRAATLVAVGARRWPSELAASFGPHTADFVENGRAVLVPADRRLERRGPDTTPFPKPIAQAAHRLARLLWPALPAEGAHR